VFDQDVFGRPDTVLASLAEGSFSTS